MMTQQAIRLQRGWARVAGVMYLVVLVVDITGMQMRSPVVGRSLVTGGSLLAAVLALGLYFAVRPVQPALAATALCFRLLEATLGFTSSVVGFDGLQAKLSGFSVGEAIVRIAHWDNETQFAAFVFTIGSTIFFYLFLKSRYIPRALAWFGLLASVVAFGACLTHLVRPAVPAMTMYPWIPMLAAEILTGLWLAIKSVKVVDASY
jgi:Domain of unknown function (DUF4386)